MLHIYIYILTATILTSLSFVSFLFLTSSSTSASDHVSNVSVTVPVSCNITSTLDTAHTATINPGQVEADIGTTTFKVFCNDNTGYAIYAIGYSNEEYGNTNMLPTNSANSSIATGLTTSGNTSSWSMKLIPTEGTYKPTIHSAPNTEGGADASFTDYHTIPNTYAKVASLTTNTDFTIGSEFKSTYKVYISNTQPADTYTGKVKYTLVHPNDTNPPADPSKPAYLDTGPNVASKIGALGGIIYILKSDSLPDDFVPADENTISIPGAPNPIYFYCEIDAKWGNCIDGAAYVYTAAQKVYMNSDSSHLFDAEEYILTDVLQVDETLMVDWDSSYVTNMSYMFRFAQVHSSTIQNLDVSNVMNMRRMFECGEGYGASTIYDGDENTFKNWNVSNVTNMSGMFGGYHGQSAMNDDIIKGLSNWDTSNVTDMSYMFYDNVLLTNIAALSSWDTSAVTNMSGIFLYVDNIDATVLNGWNVSKVTDKSRAFTCPVDKRPSWY